ncbi:YesN/AraC family two-component response regulator [Paenibacillus anaericanus]|uniref:response regulator n=1 Tax=Paenibacillus anaericanus TaxID=170367 RepID=UPI00278A9B6C|nr:response regulator [Paenibacillus anaericanus]MDQ0091224.1 YesN/AraC family two-component response regulator [Paenibacillus anaericanus]
MYKLLIVDDEEMVREGLRDIITYLQIQHIDQILTAKDGAEALSIIVSETPQIILTDLNMPVMDGIDMIKQLGEKHPHKVIVISGHDDFHRVKESFKLGVRDYLLKPAPSEDLIEVLNKTIRELQQEEQQYIEGESEKKLTQMERVSRRMNWVIQSGEHDEHAFEHVFEELGYSLPYSTTTVAVLSLIHSTSNAKSLGANWDKYLITPDRDNPSIKLYSFYNRQNDLVIWINFDEQNHNMITVKQVLQQFLTDNSELSMVVAVGEVVSKTTNLAYAYQSALDVLRYKLTANQQSIMTYGDIINRTDNKIGPIDLRNLVEIIDMGRKDQVLSFIQKYFSDDFLRKSTLESIRNNYDMILLTIGWLQNQKQDFSTFEQSEQLRLYLKTCMLQMITARESLIRSYDIVEIAKKYVQDQLQNEINMAVIANYCNVSYTYFSKIFKESTGINFQDYVTMKRMEYAKEALNGINVKVHDVATALGYSNPKNFTRVFKGYYGISPKDYQKIMK